MTRRVFLAAACASAAYADAGADAWALVGDVASALTNGEWAQLMDCFDPAMPGYVRLADDARALIREAEPRSSIEQVSNEGDDRTRTIVADWVLSLVDHANGMTSVRRQSRVTLKMEKQGKRWRIKAFDPVQCFELPR